MEIRAAMSAVVGVVPLWRSPVARASGSQPVLARANLPAVRVQVRTRVITHAKGNRRAEAKILAK